MKSYPAKLLLFGEHTVNAGSQALAVPLPLFSGKWAFAEQLNITELIARQRQLPLFADYLDQLQQRGELLAHLDVAAFRQALNKGLYFDSNIPTGYGVGSSGALVAAVYGSWQLAVGSWQSDLSLLKKTLAQMEAFFHGTSSGTDPLICFLEKPVLLGGAGSVQIVDLPPNHLSRVTSHQFFLLDTGMERQATPLIQYFLAKMQNEAFANQYKTELLPSVDGAIAAFFSEDGCRVFEKIHSIGGFQLHFLEKLVPEKFRPIWQQGLDNDLFKFKVCGAGGGGFLLGITNDFEVTKAKLAGWKLLPVMTI